MSRPKTKSALVDGFAELVSSLRKMESQLSLLLKMQKGKARGRGRPLGSVTSFKLSGVPLRGPGRPPGAKNKRKPGRPPGIAIAPKSKATNGKGRGRPKGSKNLQ